MLLTQTIGLYLVLEGLLVCLGFFDTFSQKCEKCFVWMYATFASFNLFENQPELLSQIAQIYAIRRMYILLSFSSVLRK